MPQPFLSVVIPTFNEEARIIGTLSRGIEYLAAKDYQWEIVVADDGSIDHTTDLVDLETVSYTHLRAHET